jgi:hypothetical protein
MSFSKIDVLDVIQIQSIARMTAVMAPTGYNCDVFTEPDHRKDATDNIEDNVASVNE